MKASFLVILSIFLFSAIVSGQKKLTEEEIIYYWTKTKPEIPKDKNVLPITGFDTTLHTRTIKLIDSLHALSIDTIVVYTVSYPGYYGSTKCRTGLYPVNSFVIWKSSDETYTKRLEGNCNFNIAKISPTSLFEYYDKNYSTIKNEIFMPNIYGAELSDSNTVRYSAGFSFHEPQYSIIYRDGTAFSEIKFSESELEDKKSLFHDRNLNLKSYAWWKIIKRDLNQ